MNGFALTNLFSPLKTPVASFVLLGANGKGGEHRLDCRKAVTS